jgi:ribosomal protein S18 acetylase RimI-like enzyme
MIDFTTLTNEELEILENEREKVMPNMIVETRSDNEIINELRFNYGFINFGYMLINGQNGAKLELRVTNLTGEYAERSIHLAFIGILEDSRKQGMGNNLLKILTDLADKYEYDMDLDVDTKFGMKKSILKRFYKNHGFIQSKEDKDRMYRLAKRSKE